MNSSNDGVASPDVQPPAPQLTLQEINEQIQAYNVFLPGMQSVADGITQILSHDNEQMPFIVRTPDDKFTLVARDINAIRYTKCDDNAPVRWQGVTEYEQYKVDNVRYIILPIFSGARCLVILPIWWNSPTIPGTKYFDALFVGSIKKFMNITLADGNAPVDFDPVGAMHCGQSGPEYPVYGLVPIPIQTLRGYVPATGGKRKFLTKQKNTKKQIKKNKKHNTFKKNKKRKNTKKNL